MALYFEGASLFDCPDESHRSEQDLRWLRDLRRRMIDSAAQCLRCGVDFDFGVVEWEVWGRIMDFAEGCVYFEMGF